MFYANSIVFFFFFLGGPFHFSFSISLFMTKQTFSLFSTPFFPSPLLNIYLPFFLSSPPSQLSHLSLSLSLSRILLATYLFFSKWPTTQNPSSSLYDSFSFSLFFLFLLRILHLNYRAEIQIYESLTRIRDVLTIKLCSDYHFFFFNSLPGI